MFLFADELPGSPISPSNAVVIVIIIWTLSSILQASTAVFSAVMSARRRPALEAEFTSKTEAAEMKNELIGLINKVDADVKRSDQRNEAIAQQTFAKLDAFGASISQEFSTLNRTIGRLEGSQMLANQLAEALKK